MPSHPAAHADVIQTLNQKISQLEETVGDSKVKIHVDLLSAFLFWDGDGLTVRRFQVQWQHEVTPIYPSSVFRRR